MFMLVIGPGLNTRFCICCGWGCCGGTNSIAPLLLPVVFAWGIPLFVDETGGGFTQLKPGTLPACCPGVFGLGILVQRSKQNVSHGRFEDTHTHTPQHKEITHWENKQMLKMINWSICWSHRNTSRSKDLFFVVKKGYHVVQKEYIDGRLPKWFTDFHRFSLENTLLIYYLVTWDSNEVALHKPLRSWFIYIHRHEKINRSRSSDVWIYFLVPISTIQTRE